MENANFFCLDCEQYAISTGSFAETDLANLGVYSIVLRSKSATIACLLVFVQFV